MSTSEPNGRGIATPPVVVEDDSGIGPVGPIPDIDAAYSPPEWSEEQTARFMLLFVSLGLFAVTIVLSFAVVAKGSDSTWERTSQLLNSVIPVETLIIGAAVSYYFKTSER